MTSVAFGGEEMRDLYLTTGREGFDEEKAKQYPLAGSLFVVPAVPWKGAAYLGGMGEGGHFSRG